MINKLWHWYTQIAGILAIAAAISVIVIRIGSHEGTVVEVIEGPFTVSTKIPYQGVLVYRLSTRRNESCPGNVVYTFSRDTPGQSVIISRPVPSIEIRPTMERNIRLELPDSIYPGQWHFQSSVHSQCPTYSKTDIIAEFTIEVVASESE